MKMITDVDACHRRLHQRLAVSRILFVSPTPTNFADKASCAAGPQIWNNLPTDLSRTCHAFD